MDYPQTFSDSKADITGLGLAARIAAPAAIVLPNEAGTAACEHEIAVVAARSPRQVIRGIIIPRNPIQPRPLSIG